MINSKNFKNQTKKNILFNLITFLVTVFLGIWLPPYLINNLGIAAYGLIPVSMSMVSYMFIVTISINGTIARFLAIDLATNKDYLSTTFSTGFFTILGLVILLIPLALYFSYNVDHYLSIPKGFVKDASIMFLLVLFSFFINSFSSLFSSIAYVKNRIDLRNVPLIIIRLTTLVSLFIFFSLNFINLRSYGFSIFLGTFLGTLYSYFISKKLLPDLKISLGKFNYLKLKTLAKTGFWLIIDQIGVVFFLQTDILVLNHIKGAEASGIFGTLLQWSFMIRALIAIIAGIVGPVILSLYAENNTKMLFKTSTFSIKILGLATTIITLILGFFSQDILRIWLGANFESYRLLFILITIHLGFNLAVGPLNNVTLAYNKVKIPGIVALLTGIINVVLGIILLIYTDLGYYAIALSGLISLTLKNAIFAPWYSAKITNNHWTLFYKPLLPSLLLMSIGLIIIFQFPSTYLNIENSIMKLIFFLGVAFFILSLLVFPFFLNTNEKKIVLNFIKGKLKQK